MINLTPTPDFDTFAAAVSMPEDFVDQRTAASLQAGRQVLLDQSATNFQLVKTCFAGFHYGLTPQAFGAGVWLPNDVRTVSLNYIAIQNLTDTAGNLWIPVMMLPPNKLAIHAPSARLKLNGYGMRIDPASAILPAPGGLPVVSVYSVDPFGDAHLVATKTDDSINDAAYAATHVVSVPGAANIPLTGNLGFPLWLRIRGESLGGFTAGLKLFSAWVDIAIEAVP